MLLNIRPSHLSVRTCELWQNSWLDPDAVWGDEWGRAWYGVLNFGGDRRRWRAVLGVNLGRPIVTNGEFVASLCRSAYSDGAVVWRGEWGWPKNSCVRWKSSCLKGKGLFLAWFLAFFGIFAALFSTGNDVLITDQLLCEKLTIFPYADYIVEFFVKLAFLIYSQVQDRSGGWREMYTNVSVKIRNMAIAAATAVGWRH